MEPLETRRLERGSGDSDLQLTASTSELVAGADVENEPIPLATEVPLAVKKGRITVLTLDILRELLKDKSFEIRITEEEISDRSKGDGLSKLIFMLQTSWFVVQCIARPIQGLDLTLLELTTAAMASLNSITWILWWKKPLGAQAILYVYLTRRLTDKERNKERKVPRVSVFFVAQTYSYQQ